MIVEGKDSLFYGLTSWQKYRDFYNARRRKRYKEDEGYRELVNLQKKKSLLKRLKENPEKVWTQQRNGRKRWRLRHPEREKELHRKWKKSLMGRFSKKKESLRRRTGFKDRNKILKKVLNINFLRYGITACESCGISCWKNYQFDHIIPLVFGGGNEFDNFQILCPPCNLEKRAHPIDFRSV